MKNSTNRQSIYNDSHPADNPKSYTIDGSLTPGEYGPGGAVPFKNGDCVDLFLRLLGEDDGADEFPTPARDVRS